MLARFRYLLDEGFEVGNLSGYDAASERGELGRASLTYVRVAPDGARRLVSESFDVTAKEAQACAQLFLRASRQN